MFVCHRKPASCRLTLARPGAEVAQRSFKVPDVRLNCGYFPEREKSNNNKQVWVEKAKFAAAHFCARWPCLGARVLATLIWSRPRERVKLSLLSLRQAFTASREARIQTGGFWEAEAEHRLTRSPVGRAWRIPGREHLFNAR